MKKIITALSIFIIMILINTRIYAYDFVYVSGNSIGLKMNSYVEVLGTYGINDGVSLKTPWLDKIYEHDLILKFNNEDIKSVKDFDLKLQNNKEKEVRITIKRKEEMVNEVIKPCYSNNKFTLGLYVKDYDLGIGTMTFVRQDLKYGSLGHKMIENDLLKGTLFQSSVYDILKPDLSRVGEKKANILEKEIGSINYNLSNGVYGLINNKNYLDNMIKMPIAKPNDVKVGKAKILTVISDQIVEEFDVEIKQLAKQNNDDIRGIKVKITDERLIDKAGGIVQGMSGSPIIQNGKLVGALSHVTLSDSKIGYGVYASFMNDKLNSLEF